MLDIPQTLARNSRRTPEGARWLRSLPDAVDIVLEAWELEVEPRQVPPSATASLIMWVRRADGSPAVLKLGMPHMEAEHEAHGLRHWNGDPTVRLLDVDESRNVLLLERCEPGTPLTEIPEADQDVVIAGLLSRLWSAPVEEGPFRPLAFMLGEWSREARENAAPPDPGLLREGLRLFEELPATAEETVLLATDLHAGNVLRSDRRPWLVIDPKPFVGDPAYDLVQHLLNCRRRMAVDPRGTIRRVADLAGQDEVRVGLWVFARLATGPWGVEAGWSEVKRELAP